MADRNIEEELRLHLLTIGDLTDLIGTRIYPDERPQGKPLPCLTYSLISREHRKALATGTGIALARVQIDSWSENHAETRQLAELLRINLEGFRGYFTGGDLEVKRVRLDSEVFLHEPATDGEDGGLRHAAQDFVIKYVARRPNQ